MPDGSSTKIATSSCQPAKRAATRSPTSTASTLSLCKYTDDACFMLAIMRPVSGSNFVMRTLTTLPVGFSSPSCSDVMAVSEASANGTTARSVPPSSTNMLAGSCFSTTAFVTTPTRTSSNLASKGRSDVMRERFNVSTIRFRIGSV